MAAAREVPRRAVTFLGPAGVAVAEVLIGPHDFERNSDDKH